jgi:hypothetical protein
MSIEDDDLEKAGRRQLTNSKQYSVYPPTQKHKQKSVIAVASCLLLLLFFYYSSSPPPPPPTSIFKDASQYNDSSQFTDYNHLRTLINKGNYHPFLSFL